MAPKRTAQDAGNELPSMEGEEEEAATPEAQPATKKRRWTRAQSDLYDRVEEARSTNPRFLFRYWCKHSGGNARLNTTDAITPSFHATHRGRKNFYKIPPDRLSAWAQHHVTYTHGLRTTFSSWSQTLNTVLCMAQHSPDPASTHISVLDTEMLGPMNPILHTGDFDRVLQTGSVWQFSNEYLIFGVVRGDAYKAVPYSDFTAAVTSIDVNLVDGWPEVSLTGLTIESLKALAQRYGEKLELIIAAGLSRMSVGHSWTREDLLSMLCTLNFPADWRDDPKLSMSSEVDYHGHEDAKDILRILRDVVDVSEGRTPQPEPAARPSLGPVPAADDVGKPKTFKDFVVEKAKQLFGW